MSTHAAAPAYTMHRMTDVCVRRVYVVATLFSFSSRTVHGLHSASHNDEGDHDDGNKGIVARLDAITHKFSSRVQIRISLSSVFKGEFILREAGNGVDRGRQMILSVIWAFTLGKRKNKEEGKTGPALNSAVTLP